ncbi:hypothetical protein YC2023_053150 [Brassica napus]
MSGWTVRHLSFAGRLQLLKSVIHSIINLREAVFPLPNVCIDELEQICNAFTKCLHSGSARGAKMAWDSVCTRTSLDGLGIRRLKNVKIVSALCGWPGLRRISLEKSFSWTSDFTRSGSWIWKQLVKLQDLDCDWMSQLGR